MEQIAEKQLCAQVPDADEGLTAGSIGLHAMWVMA